MQEVGTNLLSLCFVLI